MIKTILRRIACVSCAAILAVVFCFSSSAADESSETIYKSTVFFWNLASSLEEYGGTVDGVLISGSTGRITNPTPTGGSFSVPLNLHESFNRFYYGAYYPTTLSDNDYSNSATFKMVLTITTGVSGSYSGSTLPLYTALYNSNQIRKTGRVQVSSSSSCVFEVSHSNTYTFTWDDIPYDKMIGNSFFYVDIPLSNLSSLESKFYVVNSYFGLSSYYEDDVYKAATMEKLDGIQSTLQDQNNKLDSIAGSVDGVGDKVDEAADQISGDINNLQQSIETQAEKEKEMAEKEFSDQQLTVDEALDQADISPLSDPMFAGIQLLFNTISSTDTVSYIPIPEIKLPSLSVSGSNTPSVVLFEESDYDISYILQSEPVQKMISVSKVMYYIFFFFFMIDYGRKVFSLIFLGHTISTNDNYNPSPPNPGTVTEYYSKR